jgi:ribose/xylose/arabinose/galactoside ABC-type transport system permease subunit
VWRVLLAEYVIRSLLAAVAGLVLVGNTNSAGSHLAALYTLLTD